MNGICNNKPSVYATYRSTAAQMVQLVLADEHRKLVQVQHVVCVRCDLVWKKRQKISPDKMTLLFAVINYFPPPFALEKFGPRPDERVSL